jgi:hypothetical protein
MERIALFLLRAGLQGKYRNDRRLASRMTQTSTAPVETEPGQSPARFTTRSFSVFRSYAGPTVSILTRVMEEDRDDLAREWQI